MPLRLHRRYSSIGTKVTAFLKNLIANESQALSNTLESYTKMEEPDLFIHPRHRSDLAKTLDGNNRLFLLLTYNPVLVDSRLYMWLYRRIDGVDQNLRTLLLKRLLAAQEYTWCWNIVLDTYTSITDIEAFLNLAKDAFSDNEDAVFGPYKLLASCVSMDISQRVKEHVIDTAAVTFALKREVIGRWLAYRSDTDAVQTKEDLKMKDTDSEHADTICAKPVLSDTSQRYPINHINSVFYMIYLRRLLQLDPEAPASKAFLTSVRHIVPIKGWLSSIGPEYLLSGCLSAENPPPDVSKSLAEVIERVERESISRESISRESISRESISRESISRESINRESISIESIYKDRANKDRANKDRVDISYDISLNSLDTVYLLRSHSKIHPYLVYSLYTKKTSPNRYILNHLVEGILARGSSDQIYSVLDRAWKDINEDLVLAGMRRLYSEDPRNYKVLLSYKEETIIRFLDQNSDLMLRDIDSVFDFLHDCHAQGLRKAVRTIQKMVVIPNVSIDQVRAFHSRIVGSVSSKSALLESFRCVALRSDALDQAFCDQFVARLIHLCLPPRILLRKTPSMPIFPHDLQERMYLATSFEKAAFHNSLRALAQCVSLIEPMAPTLAKLKTAIDTQTHITSSYGRKYIFDSIVSDTARFLARKGKGNAVRVLQHVKKTLKAPIIDSCIFHYLVQDNPHNACKLARHFAKRKHELAPNIKYLISGILASSLKPPQKIVLVDAFLSEIRDLGYKHKLTQKTGYQVLRILESNDQADPLDRQIALKLMSDNKGLQRPVKRHLKRVKK